MAEKPTDPVALATALVINGQMTIGLPDIADDRKIVAYGTR